MQSSADNPRAPEKTFGFDLIDHPWIPVQIKNEREVLGLRDLFSRWEEITDILEEAKIRHSLYLFLVAIAHEATFRALHRHPTQLDLIKREEARDLMNYCLEYVTGERDNPASPFKDDTKFLSIHPPSFFKAKNEKELASSPETIKPGEGGGQKILAPHEEHTPEELFRRYLAVQAFYPYGPEPGSQRLDGFLHALFLGPNLGTTLRLNLHHLTTTLLSGEEESRTKSLIKQTGRAAWVDTNDLDNWAFSLVGSLTPLFAFIQRSPTKWRGFAGTKWDIVKGKAAEKEKGVKGERPYPDRLGTEKIAKEQSHWHWKYMLGSIEGVKSKQHKIQSDRKLSVRVVGVTNKDTGVRTSTIEKVYHFSNSPKATGNIQAGFKLSEEMIKTLNKTIKPKYFAEVAIKELEIFIEKTWDTLSDAENINGWREEALKTSLSILDNLPASKMAEFEAIASAKQKLKKILRP
jgi:hypothetical protein